MVTHIYGLEEVEEVIEKIIDKRIYPYMKIVFHNNREIKNERV